MAILSVPCPTCFPHFWLWLEGNSGVWEPHSEGLTRGDALLRSSLSEWDRQSHIVLQSCEPFLPVSSSCFLAISCYKSVCCSRMDGSMCACVYPCAPPCVPVCSHGYLCVYMKLYVLVCLCVPVYDPVCYVFICACGCPYEPVLYTYVSVCAPMCLCV